MSSFSDSAMSVAARSLILVFMALSKSSPAAFRSARRQRYSCFQAHSNSPYQPSVTMLQVAFAPSVPMLKK